MSRPTRVAEDAVQRLLDAGCPAALAQGHHHLDLVMHVVAPADRGNRAVDDEVVRVLLEEERRLAVGIAAHLDRMRGIVAADAIDPVNRKDGIAALDPEEGLRWRRNHEFRGRHRCLLS